MSELQIKKAGSRSTPALMWGYSKENFQETFDLLVRANLDPCALVDPSIDLIESNYPMPIIQSKDLAASSYADLSIITAPGMGYEGFEECISKIRCAEDSNPFSETNKRARVFHPCAALERHQYDLTGRILCVGFPGSGNILVRVILGRLFPKIKRQIYSLPVSGTLVPDHQQMWKKLIQTRLNVSKEEIVFQQQDMGHISLIVTCKDKRFLRLAGINCPHWHTAFIMYMHALPSLNEVLGWTLRGGAVVIVLRNPLDTIVSCAAKVFRPPSLLLNDLSWFRRAAQTLCSYLASTRGLSGDKLVINYEDLIDRPLAQIKRFAQFLEADIGLDSIAMLWNEVYKKPLVPERKHLFKPGSGKWKQYLDARHADIIEEVGLGEQMKALGYHFDRDQFKTEFENIRPLNEREVEQSQTRDFFYFLFGASPHFFADSLIQGLLPNSQINYITNNEKFLEIIKQLDEERLAYYQASASFQQYPRTWSVKSEL